MSREKEINIEDYNYVLPDFKIAKYPLAERDSSKMLVYRSGVIVDDIFSNLPEYLDNNYQLLFNNTRVIRARLRFRKETGALIEIFCLEPSCPSDHQISFSSTLPVEWRCLVGNLKKWKSGPLLLETEIEGRQITLNASLISQINNESLVKFSWSDSSYSFSEILEITGSIPVPPYLNRKEEEIDNTRYQTVYSSEDGSVAAPTAGLHFTSELIESLKLKGIETEELTLHVGAGTFVPIKKKQIGEHVMHTEHLTVTTRTIESLLKKRSVAVGTTTVRTLESIYWLGVKIIKGEIASPEDMSVDQWDPYNEPVNIPAEDSMAAILSFMKQKRAEHLVAKTSIIIVPGYSFRMVRGLITNFHMPQSTLLLLLAAITGGEWRKIYEHALGNDYRFLSYGDSSLILI